MLSAYITHADCARHEMRPHHPECPERLGAINDLLLVKGLLDHMHSYDAPLATPAQLAHAHSSLYVSEIIEVARRHCQGRVISCLEGGYVLSPLARSAAAHVKVLIGAD